MMSKKDRALASSVVVAEKMSARPTGVSTHTPLPSAASERERTVLSGKSVLSQGSQRGPKK
jgi:hypothetical protein